jgi:DNA invertase Pin-like site-specific DNA recombinase
MTVYIYGRVSHRSSGMSGLSEASQYHVCKQYVDEVLGEPNLAKTCYPETSNTLGYYFDRAQSAWRVSFDARPAAYALSQVLKPGDHIVCYSLERAFRSVKAFCEQMEHWAKLGVTFHSVTESINFGTAEGKMMSRMLAVFGEYYSDLISERTKEAMKIRRLLNVKETAKTDKTFWAESNFQFGHGKTKELNAVPGKILRYARCSHHDSMISGLGMEAQISGLGKYAERLAATRTNLTIHPEEFRDDSVSAFRIPLQDRPSGKRMLAMAEAGDVIVAYRLDRIFRTPYDAAKTSEDLAKRGVAIHIVQSGIDTLSGYGQMFLTVLSVFAYLESSIKSRRNLEVSARLKAAGRPYSRLPRHAKVLTDPKTKEKKLAYDYEMMTRMAAVYLCRNALSMTFGEISDVMHALECQSKRIAPCTRAWRKQWSDVYCTRINTQFISLKDSILPSAIDSCLRNAINYLNKRPDPIYTKHVNLRFPFFCDQTMAKIQDHLRAA